MKNVGDRVRNIDPFIVMTVLEKALAMERQGKKIIHFEIGEPDFNTPTPIIDAAVQACHEGQTHYTHSQGNSSLREAIAKYRKKSRNQQINPDQEIMVTAGTSPGFFVTLGTLLNPGDEVILSNPGYSCYPNFIRFFGGIPKFVDVFENEAFDFNMERLEKIITPRTKMILLNSPSNPTGQIIPEKSLKEIADLAIKHDLWVLSDEIYAELTYTGTIATTIASIPEMKERTIILDGFSKFWAMTGWRLGYVIAPAPLMAEMNKVNQNFLISAPSVAQIAALQAFSCQKETQFMLAEYTKRRDYITKRINQINGLSMLSPAGAFYAFVNAKQRTSDSLQFALDLLEHAHIAATPGIGFGSNGEGYIRFSYCTDLKNIEEGMNRLETYLK